jgi:hypothetical protein
VSDFWSSVDRTKKAVIVTAQSSTAEITKQTKQLRSEIDGTHLQLQAAAKIQADMEDMWKQLAQATDAIKAQQKVISSSEDFVKSVFSSLVIDYFNIGQSPTDQYALLMPPAKETGIPTVVYLLLKETPIDGTLKLQYHIYSEPPNSYYHIKHNLIVFFWGDPAANLQQKTISVSYFPDKSDKTVFHSLSIHDGQLFADAEPISKVAQSVPAENGK